MARKGRARDCVPQRILHKSTRRAAGGASPAVSPALCPGFGAALQCAPLELGSAADGSTLPWPAEILCDVGRFFGFVELSRCEALARAARRALTCRAMSLIWERLCLLHFPTMCHSVNAGGSQGSSPSCGPQSPPFDPHSPQLSPTLAPIAEPSIGDTATLDLEVAKGSTTGAHQVEFIPSCVPPRRDFAEESSSFSSLDGRPEANWKFLFAKRYVKQRRWDLAKRRGSSEVVGGIGHPGDFLPQICAGWSAADLRALKAFVAAAWKDFGGVAALQNYGRVRRYQKGGFWPQECGFRGWGSHGHWAEGLGKRPAGILRECLDGKIHCAWSCCGMDTLICDDCRS